MKWAYIFVINVWAFYLMWSDKQKAKKREWRVSESALFFVAAIGGAFGAWLGMYVFRHKTQKMPFIIGMPFLAFLTVALLWTMR
ncbi:DUF1294 domain-containing protein [Ectobacillus sp. JY-23]|uniref:DUF1294 domain-containing protein n=1 Tax=Ectobacillus sp. JY-23 TaxID=2933872 RepID=UPI001FF33E44|nr:DUF1294 domain-containing protein [Ectobacillus sp. JY-23]UOY93199.1 DUF1294 domain-containing protein [Ectobacillus sp. JY-23]